MIGFPKPKPRRLVKAAKDRREDAVKRHVRAECVRRDGYCRILFVGVLWPVDLGPCCGPSEWAHLGALKRARTRGMDPQVRHTTAGSLMLCRKHHHGYDDGLLKIEILEPERGADGRLRFT